LGAGKIDAKNPKIGNLALEGGARPFAGEQSNWQKGEILLVL